MATTSSNADSNRSTDLVTFSIKIEGTVLPATYRIVFIDIENSFNKISSAMITLLDGDPATRNFSSSSDEHLVPGKNIEILGGYSSNETSLFKGMIIRHKIKMKKRGDSHLMIECKDLAYRMSLSRKSAYFTDYSDSDLFEQLVAEYPDLSIEADATTYTHPEIVQFQLSDWDLMLSRAEKIGMYVCTDNGTVKIFKPVVSGEPAHTLGYGTNILDFDLEMDARLQYTEVKAHSWDMAEQNLQDAEVSDADSTEQGNINAVELAESCGNVALQLKHSGHLEQQELDDWTAAQMSQMRLAKIRGTVKTQGTEVVKPRDLVKLEGLGERFNGNTLVTGVRHALGKGDWITALQLGVDPQIYCQKFPVNPLPGSGFYSAIKGLHIGIVTQLEGDPDGEERILVRVPIIDNEQDGIWSRLATLDAGDNRGTVVRPEIGDEVIIGFIDQDPRQAVILGMLHSSAHPAPITASDDNHLKGWVSRSDMQLVFNDEDPSFSIKTANGNILQLSDKEGSLLIEDENGNSVTLDSEGITLDSAKNIKINASQDIQMEAMNISIKANIEAVMEGGASSALKSGGNTEVKGALVQIN